MIDLGKGRSKGKGNTGNWHYTPTSPQQRVIKSHIVLHH